LVITTQRKSTTTSKWQPIVADHDYGHIIFVRVKVFGAFLHAVVINICASFIDAAGRIIFIPSCMKHNPLCSIEY
jgi:hypothetical protein